MVIINEKKYENTNYKISYGEYNVNQNGKKRKGISPFLRFKCNNINIGIEMTYDIKCIEETKINTTIDITKYISDILFENEKYWLSLIIGEFSCWLSKIEDDKFVIELKYKGEECDMYFYIYINETINFKA